MRGEQGHVTTSPPITAHLELPDVGVEAVLGHEGGRAGAGLGPRQLHVAVLHQVPLPHCTVLYCIVLYCNVL